MGDFFKNLTNTQLVLIVLIVIAVLYIFMKQSENLDDTKKETKITNKSNDKQDATELKQEDIPTPVMLYDRKTGVVTHSIRICWITR